jgi:integrase
LRLIASTAASQKIVSGMPGHVRALLYRLEFFTGILHNELRQLERRDFDFTEKIPTVTVRTEIGKVSKDRVIPLDGHAGRRLARTFMRPRAECAGVSRHQHQTRRGALARRSESGGHPLSRRGQPLF